MKITINKKENVKAYVGDLLLISDEGCETLVRQIIEVSGTCYDLDIEDGMVGYTAHTVEDLVNRYKHDYDSVTVVKNSDVEVIIGGMN